MNGKPTRPSLSALPVLPPSPSPSASEKEIKKWSQGINESVAASRAQISQPAYPWSDVSSDEVLPFLLRRLPKRISKKLHYIKAMSGNETMWQIMNDAIEAEVDRRLLELGVPKDAL